MTAMRLSRLRAAFVLVAAVLHLCAGVALALAPCCDNTSAHEKGERRMECCLKGGPNHVCPFMSSAAKKKAAAGGRIAAVCAAGHDQGVPAMGFAGVPPDPAWTLAPEFVSVKLAPSTEAAATHTPRISSPPPRA